MILHCCSQKNYQVKYGIVHKLDFSEDWLNAAWATFHKKVIIVCSLNAGQYHKLGYAKLKKKMECGRSI